MPSGIARPPQSDAVRVNFWTAFEIRDRATPVSNLSPWINVLARFTAASAEGPMIVQQHDKTGVSESLSKLREAALLYGGVAVRHRDGRATRCFALWKIKPSAKFRVTISRERDFAAGHYYEYLFTGLRIAARRHRVVIRPHRQGRARALRLARVRQRKLVHRRTGRMWKMAGRIRRHPVRCHPRRALPDRRIKPRRKSMSRHKRSRNRVADVILERLPRPK